MKEAERFLLGWWVNAWNRPMRGFGAAARARFFFAALFAAAFCAAAAAALAVALAASLAAALLAGLGAPSAGAEAGAAWKPHKNLLWCPLSGTRG